MSEDAVLEQRERKPRRAAAPEANGNASDVPDFAAAEDFAADVPAGDSTDVPEPEDVEEPSTSSNKIYFVRVPRPPINDEAVKKLTAQFNEHVAKVKGANAKLAAKREELRELRRQLGVGRSLKDGSQPEYEEKSNRLQSLRELRKNYTSRMGAIRDTLRGLDCKSEEELDAKVKELEDRISFGGLTLREEKLTVGQISKLKSQRVQVRDYANQKATLDELQSEYDKVKGVISELEGEFDILKAERGQASGIIKEILTKVKACEAEVKDLEEEQKEAVNAKNDALAALEKARAEMNESMADYRDNRSFSLKVRDMVTAGQVDEARALCGAQTDEIIAKVASDVAYRKEYYSLWAAQRKYAVSELLPDSTSVVKEAKPADAKGAGKGKADAKAAKAPPPKPQGAEKARMLIEQFLAEAQQEASRKAAGRPATDGAEVSSGDADDELDLPSSAPAAAVAAPVVEAVKPKAAASARPADLLKYVELPKIEDVEFVPPVIKTDEEKAAAKAAQDKERQREEQIKKAQEAEARKKKAAEVKEKKRKEAEAKRKAEEEVRKAEAASQEAERVKRAAAERAEAEAKRKAAAEAAKAAAEAKASYNPAAKVIAKSQVKVVAKPKPPSNDVLRYWKAFKKNTNLQLAILGVVLTVIMLILVIMAMRS